MALSVVRACGIPWLIHGFLPGKNATSQCSKSPRNGVPNILPMTSISPVFSCAIAFVLNRTPSAPCVAAP